MARCCSRTSRLTAILRKDSQQMAVELAACRRASRSKQPLRLPWQVTQQSQSSGQSSGRRFRWTRSASIWLPRFRREWRSIRKVAAALNAPELLPIEFGRLVSSDNFSCLYHVYVAEKLTWRNQTGNTAPPPSSKDAGEQRHRWNCSNRSVARVWEWPLPIPLQQNCARQMPMPPRAALAAYKDFLTLWRNTDPISPS